MHALSTSGHGIPVEMSGLPLIALHAIAQVQVKCEPHAIGAINPSTVPHLLIKCGAQHHSEYLMERVLSTTFGKHSNFWSGNRLVVADSPESSLELFKVKHCDYVHLLPFHAKSLICQI